MELTIAILTFTVAGFALGCFNTGRNIWKETGTKEPRNLSNADVTAVAGNLKGKMEELVRTILSEEYNLSPAKANSTIVEVAGNENTTGDDSN